MERLNDYLISHQRVKIYLAKRHGHKMKIEKIIFGSSTIYEQSKRAKLFEEISQKALLDKAFMILLFFQVRTSALNQSLKGFETNLLGKKLFGVLERTIRKFGGGVPTMVYSTTHLVCLLTLL